jgi:hypothetical protein
MGVAEGMLTVVEDEVRLPVFDKLKGDHPAEL